MKELIHSPFKAATALMLLAFLLYMPTIKYGYVWDDDLVITGNEITKKGFSGIAEIWTTKSYIEDRPTYRPVPQTMFAMEWGVAPNNPHFSRFINVLLYMLVIGVLYFLLHKFFPHSSPFLLFFIGLLYVVHPTHVEVVANIKSRDELSATLFSILTLSTLFFSVKLIANQYLKYFTSIVLIIISLLSKPSAFTILPLIFIWIYAQNRVRVHYLSNKAFVFLVKYWRVILNGTLQISFGLIFIYLFDDFSAYVLLATVVFLFNYNLVKKNIDLFFFIVFSLLFLKFYTYSSVIVLLFFFVYVKSYNQTLSTNSIKIISVCTALLIFINEIIFLKFNVGNILNAFFWIALINIYVLYHKKYRNIYLFLFTLLPVVYVSVVFFKGKEVSVSALFTFIAFLIILLLDFNVFSKKILVIRYLYPLLFLALHFHPSVSDTSYLDKISFFSEIVEDELILPAPTDRVLLNQPYFNILVAAENTSQKMATIARVQWLYMQKLFYPHPLVHQHGAWQIKSASFKDWDVWLSIFVHLFLIGFVLKRIRKRCPIAIGILFYLVTISIYTNIFYLMPDTMAERFLFLPSVGFCIALVFGINRLAEKFSQQKSYVLTGIVLLPFFLFYTQKTWQRSKDWKDNYTLTANTIPFAKDNAVINAQYGAELKKKLYKNPEDFTNPAETVNLIEYHFKRAIDIYPDFYNANADLGLFYIEQAHPEKAFPFFKKAVELNDRKWINYYYLGLIYYDRTEYYKAMLQFREVLAKMDDEISQEERTNTYEYLGRALFTLNKVSEMKEILVENYTNFGEKSSMVLAGNLLAQKGRIQDALEIFYKLQSDYPNDDAIQPTIDFLKKF